MIDELLATSFTYITEMDSAVMHSSHQDYEAQRGETMRKAVLMLCCTQSQRKPPSTLLETCSEECSGTAHYFAILVCV